MGPNFISIGTAIMVFYLDDFYKSFQCSVSDATLGKRRPMARGLCTRSVRSTIGDKSRGGLRIDCFLSINCHSMSKPRTSAQGRVLPLVVVESSHLARTSCRSRQVAPHRPLIVPSVSGGSKGRGVSGQFAIAVDQRG